MILNLKGKKLPPTAMYVGRAFAGNPASPLANPFVIGRDGDRETVIAKYRRHLWERMKARDKAVLAALVEINVKGLDLACWCAPLPCHASVVQNAAAFYAHITEEDGAS